jgi:hypothetical protein
MVEVFKTNITDYNEASVVLDHIHYTFDDYKANFDLEDCDNILRIQSSEGDIHCTTIISFLKKLGCDAEVLPDEPATITAGLTFKNVNVVM